MPKELERLKDDLKNVPTFVWWVGAGAIAVIVVVKRMQGNTTSTVDTSAPVDTSVPSVADMSSAPSVDMSATNSLLQQLLTNQQQASAVQGPPVSTTLQTPDMSVATVPNDDFLSTIFTPAQQSVAVQPSSVYVSPAPAYAAVSAPNTVPFQSSQASVVPFPASQSSVVPFGTVTQLSSSGPAEIPFGQVTSSQGGGGVDGYQHRMNAIPPWLRNPYHMGDTG